MTAPKYFVYPFATAGDTATIPDPTQGSGVMSYQEGFGPDYQLVDSDPASLNIPRDQFNQLMKDITGAIQQIQQNGVPYFITSTMNDGSAYSYSKNAIVYQVSDGNVYQSTINSNTNVPPGTGWQLFGVAASSLWLNFAADTGAANAYVVAPSPAITAYAIGQVVLLKPTVANTGASTINVNGKGVKSIKTMGNTNPTAGMIAPPGVYICAYNGSNFVLLNPTTTAPIVNIVRRVISSSPYVPTAGMVKVQVEGVGAGGGGGAASQAGSAGGGGGAGERALVLLTAAQIGASQTFVLGTGGAGGTVPSNTGSSGTSTTFGSFLTAHGGLGGVGSSSGAGGGIVLGGLGGSGGTGDEVYSGASGFAGAYVTTIGQALGNGANSLYGAGGQCIGGVTGGTTGANALGYGAGGSGANGHLGAAAGGNGSNGTIIVTEYCSQ